MEFMEGSYLITGITGYLGSVMAKALMDTDKFRAGDIRITGISRNASESRKVFDTADGGGLIISESDIKDSGQLFSAVNFPVDYIIHCACSTQSAEMITHPVEVADGIVLGTRNMLELARKCTVRSFVFLSSMEVYGIVDDTGALRREHELGSVSLESPRSCYSMGKRMAEHYCHIYQQEYGVPVKIARLSQTFGRGVRPGDNRIYMQFARAAYEGKDIVLKTLGNSLGNYCAIEDAVKGIFTILNHGEEGEVYNVVNEANTMRIRDMAELVANQAADGAAVRVETEDPEKNGYAPDTGLRISGEKLRKLGWMPTKALPEMYEDVIKELESKITDRL